MRKTRGPLWAWTCVVLGGVFVLASAGGFVVTRVATSKVERSVHTADLFGPQPEFAADRGGRAKITGPLNILLVGIDPRPENPEEAPHGDSVMILHVPRELDRAYLFSLPRDLLVDIPAWERAQFAGSRYDKLTHAMTYGARRDGAPSDVASGFGLLARTVSGYTGITSFDAGLVINFAGFQQVVAELGGVDMYIDQRVESIHLTPDGEPRWKLPGDPPHRVYEPGPRHLSASEALDYVRQRYTEGGDYTRQRHQQQFIRALVSKATSVSVLTSPGRLGAVVGAAGDALTFDGRGASIVDFAVALHGIGQDRMALVRLPGHNIGTGAGYQGEELEPVAKEFFAAVASDRVDEFLGHHLELINR
ncbi:LCP family protein [Longispora sp. K20-0274]|uniref:LCP family protein n=1 Tax=Longispora sp. K20-0274 TaxID=3088255 RepID=UPI00399995E8